VATLEELFKGEFGYMKLDSEITFSQGDVVICKAIGRLYLAFEEYASFLGYYVTEEFATPQNLQVLIAQRDDTIRLCHSSVESWMSHPVYDSVGAKSTDLPFTGRVILYVEAHLHEGTRQALIEFGNTLGLRVQFRDRSYEDFMNATERPLAFMSHDSRDKPFVEQVASKLRGVLCPVWYDAFSLKPGDSLRESIDAGLRDSKRCVIVLSPNFFTNPGWGRAEFNAAMNKHFASGGNVVIPIWHGVTRDEVADYSPLVADIVSINSAIGVDEVFSRLHRVLTA
jgi:hypothetical protein